MYSHHFRFLSTACSHSIHRKGDNRPLVAMHNLDSAGLKTEDFDYDLPPRLIAQSPAPNREDSRLLVLNRTTGAIQYLGFESLRQFLAPGDLLVANNSRVIPARLRGVKEGSSGRMEMLLVEEVRPNEWWVLLRPGKRVRPGTRIRLEDLRHHPTEITATVEEKLPDGRCRLVFAGAENLMTRLPGLGETPLPPYIARATDHPQEAADRERYQTVYAARDGSAAAPTAGLHFSEPLLQSLKAHGVGLSFVTLHVGLGTFAPVKAGRLSEHVMHEERFELSAETATAINATKKAGHKIVSIGTTTLRVLESVAAETGGELRPLTGRTRIFIHPPGNFRVVDALVTNFHLPCSTLLMLVSAFAAPGRMEGRDLILRAYREAIAREYRFFSYGDAMLIH